MQVGGKAASSLIKVGRQADCGAQPAQLPGTHLAANSAEVPALSPGTQGRPESQAPAHLCCSEAAHALQRKP